MRKSVLLSTGGEIDAEGKPRFHGFEGFGAEGPGFGRRAQAGGPGFQHFEFNFGGGQPGGAAEGLNPGDIFSELFGAGQPPGAGVAGVAPPGRRPAAKM